MLLTRREAPKNFNVFIKSAKRCKFLDAYFYCNPENRPAPPCISATQYWEIVQTPFMKVWIEELVFSDFTIVAAVL
jgi:hypothetical protein